MRREEGGDADVNNLLYRNSSKKAKLKSERR